MCNRFFETDFIKTNILAKNQLNGNHHISWICEILEIILETKVFQKLKLSKNDFDKKNCSLKMIILNWKKIWKVWIILGIKYSLWKSDFGTFWQTIHKIEWFSLHIDFRPKMFLCNTHHLWNSTTKKTLHGNRCETGARQLFINKQVCKIRNINFRVNRCWRLFRRTNRTNWGLANCLLNEISNPWKQV